MYVSLGTSDTMRCGGWTNTSVRPRSSVTFSARHAAGIPHRATGPRRGQGRRPKTPDAVAAGVRCRRSTTSSPRRSRSCRPRRPRSSCASSRRSLKKRKIQLTGYLVAMVVWLVGMIFALVYYGTHDGFVGWVFLVPFALVGADPVRVRQVGRAGVGKPRCRGTEHGAAEAGRRPAKPVPGVCILGDATSGPVRSALIPSRRAAAARSPRTPRSTGAAQRARRRSRGTTDRDAQDRPRRPARAMLATSPPGDLRLFVVEQRGAIRIIDNETLLPDAVPRPQRRRGGPVAAGGEQGLLGLAFHPKYATNGAVLRLLHARPPGNALRDVVARCSVSADRSRTSPNPTCAEVLSIPDFAGNHNGGMIEFGQDGYLYIGTGDGGGGGDPQAAPRRTLERAARQDPAHRRRHHERPARSTASRPTTRSRRRRRSPRSSCSACATRGAGRSTARPATCGSATSARAASRSSTVAAARAAEGREPRLEHVRGRRVLPTAPCTQPAREGDRRRTSALHADGWDVDHRRPGLSRHAATPTSSAGTSTRDYGDGRRRQGAPQGRRHARDRRPPGLVPGEPGEHPRGRARRALRDHHRRDDLPASRPAREDAGRPRPRRRRLARARLGLGAAACGGGHEKAKDAGPVDAAPPDAFVLPPCANPVSGTTVTLRKVADTVGAARSS